jgi:prevent-host-death family protein
MRELVISVSVTQAARTFADCVNRVRYQGASFILHKNGVPVARIVPVGSVSSVQLEPLSTALSDKKDEGSRDESAAAIISEIEEHPQNQQPSKIPRRPVLNW